VSEKLDPLSWWVHSATFIRLSGTFGGGREEARGVAIPGTRKIHGLKWKYIIPCFGDTKVRFRR